MVCSFMSGWMWYIKVEHIITQVMQVESFPSVHLSTQKLDHLINQEPMLSNHIQKTVCEHKNFSNKYLDISYSPSSSTLPGIIHEYNHVWTWCTMNNHILNFGGDSILTNEGTFVLQPMCTMWYPHVPSHALTNTVFIPIEFHCVVVDCHLSWRIIHVPLATLEPD